MKAQFPVYTRGMRRAMRILFVLSLPGLVFGFLNSVPTYQTVPYDPYFPSEQPGWESLVLGLLMVPPVLLVGYAIYVVIDWLKSAPHPDPPAKP